MKRIRFVCLRSSVILLFVGLLGLSYCATSGKGAMGGLTYSPAGKGFAYKSVAVPKNDFRKWAAVNRKKIQKAIDSLEEGYVLEVVGHTDSSGPRNAVGSRRGNIWYSTKRARAVRNAFVNVGVAKSKLRYRGIADDELLVRSKPYSQTNRRVNFRIRSK